MATEHSPARVSSFDTTQAERAPGLDVEGTGDRAAPSLARAPLWLPTVSLWWREIVRFYRQRSRWVGVILSPLVFWVVIGSGLGNSFRAAGSAAGRGYLEYFFPGTLVLTLLFTSIFCMMTVIEDRKEGFLLSVLVSPAPRASLVLGKILGGTTLAVLQGLLFLLFAPVAGIHIGLTNLAAVLGTMFLISFGLTALGFLIAWRLDSTHGFHALINLLLIPMWMLSGALFPTSGASSWVGWMMRANPLTYGVLLLRRALYPGAASAPDTASLTLALCVAFAFGGVMFILALLVASRREGGVK